MEKKKALKIVLIGAGSIFVLLTGALIVLPRVLKSTSEEKKEDETKQDNQSVGGSSASEVNPLGDTEAVKKFQDWMDEKHPKWLDNGESLNKGTGYGNFGKQTDRAWAKYGPEYQKTNTVVPPRKTVKVYAIKTNTPVYGKPGDVIPVRIAASSEYLGDLTGAVKKDSYGNRYVELKLANGKLRYAIYGTVKLTQ